VNTDRVKEAGQVLKEILNIPDNIPQDLLDKAECLIQRVLSSDCHSLLMAG